MKVALVCPANILFMPYVDNYKIVLEKANINYEIINWDRAKIEDDHNPLIFRDKKTGMRRNFFDYHRYKKFIVKALKANNYDRIIIFGLQLSYYLRKELIKNYQGNYIIDIRDYNKILKFFKINELIDYSFMTVLSSPGFLKWLPHSSRYVINHNTKISRELPFNEINANYNNLSQINLSYIGTIRDFDINIQLIEELKNNKNINLYFHGASSTSHKIEDYLDLDSLDNVTFTGRFNREDEANLYLKSDMINILIPNDDINSRTLLPNRLYNAVFYGKPILYYHGTYLADLISKYNLGVELKDFNLIDEQLANYFKNFDCEKYYQGRKLFFEKVFNDNQIYNTKLLEFVKHKK